MIIPGSARCGDQVISFNCYSLQSQKKFHKFYNDLKTSREDQYNNINDVFELARNYSVVGVHGSKSTIVGNIAF